MRIRPSIPLPGPFSLVGGHGRPNAGAGVLLAIVGLFYLGAWFAWTVPMLIAHAAVLAVAGVVLAAKHSGRED